MKKLLLSLFLLITMVSFGQDNTQTIADYLSNNVTSLGLRSADVADFKVSSQSYSESMNVTNVYILQTVNGIEVYNTASPIAIRDNQVMSASVSFINDSYEKFNTAIPSISAQDAIAAVASKYNLGPVGVIDQIENPSEYSYIFSKGSISSRNIPVKLVYEKDTNDELRLAWDLSLDILSGEHYYSVRVDAVTGLLISSNDWVISCDFGTPNHNHSAHTQNSFSILEKESTDHNIQFSAIGGESYRVYPMPIESPNHGSDQLVINPANTVASPFGWHDTDGVAGPEFTITRGNNVIARDDIDGNNTGGLSPDGGASLTFDFPYQYDTSPINMLDAATTNLFYWNNLMHDVWYQYGFDEASGNFQSNNYGNGGNANDFVDAQSQDGSRFNNANFATPPDGLSGRMQMFLWSPTEPAGNPLLINNGALMGDYPAPTATFGDPLPEDIAITSDFALVIDDNSGVSTDENDACDSITNGVDLDGKIVIIRRGECQFGFKVLAAENQGAVAVIIVNNIADDPINMGPGDVGDQVTIPSVMINQADGEAIITALLNGDIVNGSLIYAGPYNIDGDVDNGIIAHEYGHGISNRLTGGGSNAGCLVACLEVNADNQCIKFSEQVGEGWSDWFGLMLTMSLGDTGGDIRGIGTYVRGEPTDGGGIREAPYTTDFAINDYTFGRTNNQVSAPHGLGFVFATALWEMTWDLIDQYGYDDDKYNGTGGNNIAMQLVIDGLKLQPCNPTQIQSRDAILEADILNNNGANQCLIWSAFARRGYGVSADSGLFTERNDQTEAFDVPSTPDCILLSADRSSLDNNFILSPNPTNGDVNIRTVINVGNVTVAIYDLNGRKVLSQEITLDNTATISTNGLRAGVYIVNIEGDNYTHTTKLIKE